MNLRVVSLLALPLLILSCSSTKPATSSAYSKALTSPGVKSEDSSKSAEKTKPADKDKDKAKVADKPKVVDKQSAPIVASKTGKVYHSRYCRYAASLTNIVGFASAREAEAKGLIPCEFCNPQMNAAAAPEK